MEITPAPLGGVTLGQILITARDKLLSFDNINNRHVLWKLSGGKTRANATSGDLLDRETSSRENGLNMFPIWAQSPGSADRAATGCFFSRCHRLLYLLQVPKS